MFPTIPCSTKPRACASWPAKGFGSGPRPSRYFDVLATHGVGHVYNQWQRMPRAGQQWEEFPPDLHRTPAGSRLLLKSGRAYQEAVDTFSPYTETKEPLPEVRQAATSMLRDALRQKGKKPFAVYVNNRLEGNALNTIAGILDAVP